MREKRKSAGACTVIGGADGPASVFVLGREITANPHTLDEVITYMTGK